MIRWVFALAILLPAFATGAAKATDAPDLDVIAAFKTKGSIAVAMLNQDFPPMIYTDQDGNVDGFDPRIARTIAEAIGVELEIMRTATTFEEVIDQVARGDADIAVSYLTTAVSRARRVVFTQPYLSQSLIVAVNRVYGTDHFEKCPTLDGFLDQVDSANIGLVRNSAYELRFEALKPDTPYQPYENPGDLITALGKGEVDMAILGKIIAISYLDQHPEMNVYVSLCELKPLKEDIAIAVNGQIADLVPFLNIVLNDVSITIDGEKAELRIDPWY